MATGAGKRRSWLLVVGLAVLAIGRARCAGPGDTDGPGNPVLGEVLADVWPEVLEPAVGRAAGSADSLVAACEAWNAVDGVDGVERVAAQEAWRQAMTDWQAVEVLQVGPIASSLTAVAGADLRDRVYSWPTTNRCRVDQETIEAAWDDSDFFAANLVNVYGLAALETLLFSPAGENACPAQVDINANDTWGALGRAGVQENRAAYAATLARNVRSTIGEIETAWSPDFAASFASAGQDASPYESQEQALNAIFDALFYLDTRAKDRKLGGPLGLRDCGTDLCMDLVETRLAGGSNVWLRANLASFRALFLGGAGAGFDDLLVSLGHDDLVTSMLAALDRADAAALALEVPVDVAANSDPTQAVALHTAISEVSDLLQRDIATVLTMQVPSEAAGDND